MRGPGRPAGEVRQALARAAEMGPATVRELAKRAQVGMSVAHVTATRMRDRGELVVLVDSRPAVLAVPGTAHALYSLHRSFWHAPASQGDAQPPASFDDL